MELERDQKGEGRRQSQSAGPGMNRASNDGMRGCSWSFVWSSNGAALSDYGSGGEPATQVSFRGSVGVLGQDGGVTVEEIVAGSCYLVDRSGERHWQNHQAVSTCAAAETTARCLYPLWLDQCSDNLLTLNMLKFSPNPIGGNKL